MKPFSRILFPLFMAAAIAFSFTFFSLCYRLDNKYTQAGPQAVSGVLMLNQDLPSDSSVFLVSGWEIYRNKLLAPEDFADGGSYFLKEDISIGQYGGFEGSDSSLSPHGSATYRMNIVIPSEPAAYMLELPEIYSAYKLYINGKLTEQLGDPSPALYRPQTGNTAVSITAENNIEIIIAVSDYSYIYSGMVYPPAFGASSAVSSLLVMRLTLRTSVCAAALVLAVFFLASGLLMKRDRLMLLFGLICLCFIGYTCCPIVKTIARGGLAWYGFKNLCFVVMLVLVMLLQSSVLHNKEAFPKELILLGTVVCCGLVLLIFISTYSLYVLTVCSKMIELYKWGAALILTANIMLSPKKISLYGCTMLAGVLAFDCALVMDRLLPLYEPIISGYFIEMASFSIVLTLGCVTGQEAVRQHRKKAAFESKLAGIESLVAMQQSSYPVILESVEEARRARHDLRHHLNMINGLLSAGRKSELEHYLSKYSAREESVATFNYCDNYVVDVILRHFAALAAQEGIIFTVDAQLPKTLKIDNADICSIISNLLENAVEACAYVKNEKKISAIIKRIHSQFVILIDNSFDGTTKVLGSRLLSRKRHDQEGVGLDSVRAAATKYGGSAVFIPDFENCIFHSEVNIPNL